MSLQVILQEYEHLSPEEQANASNNGSGKEYANYIRVQRGDTTVYLESDAMEREDARFTRDLKWIIDAIEYAYQCGITDATPTT